MTLALPTLTDAACATPQGLKLFADADGDATQLCREICATCPVQRACLQWGVLHEHEGMWGGLLPDELETERRRHQIRLTKPTFSLHQVLQQQAAAKRNAGAAE